MYDKIRRRIEQRISEEPRLSVKRLATDGTFAERDTSLILAHVTAELDRHISEMYDDIDALEAAAQPRDAVREFGGLGTQRQLEKHFVEKLSVDIGSSMTTFNFTVPSGSSFFGPPYDLKWSVGSGIAFSALVDGKVHAFQSSDGFSAAGIGFYLTTNEPVLAAITPQGTYDFNWVSFADLPFARSRGGMGIAIYTDEESQPTLSREPVLWSTNGMTLFEGEKGSGRIADAASPAFGLGSVPLGPALVNMVPGSSYLVWVWCWQTSRPTEDAEPFMATVRFHMPLVTINAGPPIVIG